MYVDCPCCEQLVKDTARLLSWDEVNHQRCWLCTTMLSVHVTRTQAFPDQREYKHSPLGQVYATVAAAFRLGGLGPAVELMAEESARQ